ncbi:MAG: UDP-N-acetylmuramate--L-alanine ligase [Acidimicrobiia bacterium]
MVELGGPPLRLHVVAAGGSAMSALAEILATMGHTVSGCDLRPSAALDRLASVGVATVVGHDRAHAAGQDALAVSTAVPPDNPDVAAAAESGVPVLARADLLSALCGMRRTIAVAGSHGKTTTSALLASLLTAAGRDPSYLVGGRLAETGTGARWGSSEWFVAEADESDGTFLRLPAEVAVVTSVEPDHLEHWGGFPALVAGFELFLASATAQVVYGGDEGAARIARRGGYQTYGFGPADRWRIVDFQGDALSCRFRLVDAARGDEEGATVDLPLPGRHNAANAAAALLAASHAGLPLAEGAPLLAGFGGVARRFQRRGERDGVTFVDDYAHLPGEVAATVAAARAGAWRRVVCVFQPHRYSRTSALWRDFGHAFDGADTLAVTDIYAADEPPRPGVTGKLVLDAALDAGFDRPAAWLPTRAALLAWLRRELRPGDLCLTLGAGDLTTLPDDLLDPR